MGQNREASAAVASDKIDRRLASRPQFAKGCPSARLVAAFGENGDFVAHNLSFREN
jgi:hypothetical protein